MVSKCKVENCIGKYQEKTISYVSLHAVNTEDYEITVNAYNQLQTKEGYHPVIDTLCDICGDDLDKRLINFIQQNSDKLIKG